MGKNTSIIVRTATRAELDLATVWAREEGWNPGINDAASFHAADPRGFFVGLLDGEPVAFISGVTYGAAFGFLGFYLVRPEHRGKGYGLKVWDAAVAYLGERVIGLDGVVAQQDNYRRSGFTLAYRNIRFQGVGTGPVEPASGVVPLAGVPFPQVLTYDSRMFAFPRERFLRVWLAQPGSQARAMVRNGALAGYGVMRQCHEGFKIGPLFAGDEAVAENLFQSFAACAGEGMPLFLDVPEPHAAAVALAERNGMTPAFETARMYKGGTPPVPVEQVFGVTTFELG